LLALIASQSQGDIFTHLWGHNLEKVGQGHPSANLSEAFPKCTCKLNLKKLGPFAGDLSHPKGGGTDGRTDNPTTIAGRGIKKCFNGYTGQVKKVKKYSPPMIFC
jgi:hypothetical protein